MVSASTFPRALNERAHTTTITPTQPHIDAATCTIGEPIPTLLAHPDPDWWQPGATPTPAPVCLWFHGRTVNKELDPGRYLRWVRAGIAACAIDLPGHGQRHIDGWGESTQTLRVAEQAACEVNAIIEALSEPRFNNAFDTSRIAIGGMSAGGMVTLIRLCSEHPFCCAAVESTMGDFMVMADRAVYDEQRAHALNPIEHLENWRPIPLLALHSESDEWVPVQGIRRFINTLKDHYANQHADPDTIILKTWPTTGTPYEHSGFGRVSNEAKNLQTDILKAHLLG